MRKRDLKSEVRNQKIKIRKNISKAAKPLMKEYKNIL